MVLTVTLNPAIDKLFILNGFQLHKLHRLCTSEVSYSNPGGKGVNIAINLSAMGNEVIASGFAGGHAGHLLTDSIRQKGITTNFIFTDGDTRTNLSILDKKNETLTAINDYGQIIYEDDMVFFLDNYHKLLKMVDFVVIAGSLPKGITGAFYATLISMAKMDNIPSLVHVSPKLATSVLEVSPFAFCPDMRSYHRFLGKPLDGIDEFFDVGRAILKESEETEFVLFIHRIENVVAITREKAYVLRPLRLSIVNMLGYGDAFLSGFVDGFIKGKTHLDMLKFASAAGLTNVECLHKDIQDISLIEKNLNRIEVEEIV